MRLARKYWLKSRADFFMRAIIKANVIGDFFG